jgi:hypothetical protein
MLGQIVIDAVDIVADPNARSSVGPSEAATRATFRM